MAVEPLRVGFNHRPTDCRDRSCLPALCLRASHPLILEIAAFLLRREGLDVLAQGFLIVLEGDDVSRFPILTFLTMVR